MKEMAVIFVLLGLVMANNPAVAAVLPYAISPEEMRRLPPYCAARMQMPQNSPEARSWRAQIGSNFEDFYHYCSGLNFINRYWSARSTRERKSYLQQAKSEFDYIVRGLEPDFTMGAELFSNRGEVFKLMGKSGDAVKDFMRAISINPQALKPYLQLADLHERAKDRVRVLGVVTEGLRNIPDSKALQHRYLELGGKEPFPEPLAAKAVIPESVKQSEPTHESANTPNQDPEGVPTSAAKGQADEGVSNPAIGTPQNPYCRFCPPED